MFNTQSVFVKIGSGLVGYPQEDFLKTADDNLQHKTNGISTTLYQSLKTALMNDGPLLAFADIISIHSFEITPGVITRVSLPKIERLELFAFRVPTMVMGPVSQDEQKALYYIPFIQTHDKEENILNIGSTTFNDPITAKRLSEEFPDFKFKTNETFYFYIDKGLSWEKTFYESLSDYNNKNYKSSILKICSSVELYADHIVKKYLEKQNSVLSLLRRCLIEQIGKKSLIK